MDWGTWKNSLLRSRDGWLMSDQAPTICLHGSYRRGRADERGIGDIDRGVGNPPEDYGNLRFDVDVD